MQEIMELKGNVHVRRTGNPSSSFIFNANSNDHNVDASNQSATSTRDDALLLASFADVASSLVTSKKATKSSESIGPTSVSPMASINSTGSTPILPKRFPSLPSLRIDHQNPLIPSSVFGTRPRAISYAPNEVTRLNANIVSAAAKTASLLLPQGQQSPPLVVKPQQAESFGNRRTPRTILRKKFSWKHYPPLEDFLIANREEYLRHSTLNYTLQQKKYNNMLTEQMIQLASQHGYVFDQDEFSFVTVRDRIRCYYKSYVQSLKKRGIVCGYAAKKAGLISKEEMSRNATNKSMIYVPNK
mmetsp:Transcript_11514/g.17277  ORF Transcript_11514/g.17277 Transcript_11514/m.17277 type:complete len:300 (+) Transcript_11514:171-1070(+)